MKETKLKMSKTARNWIRFCSIAMFFWAFFEIVSVFAPGYGLEYLAFGIKDLIIGVGFWAAFSYVQES